MNGAMMPPSPYMRTSTYKEKTRDYVMAARALGASSTRIVARHILPNTVSVIVTFIPFSIASGITALTALDYLGFGLLPPTPSWGDLLSQGTDNLDSPWIVTSVVTAMIVILLMVTYIGEAIREAFDPKRFTFYSLYLHLLPPSWDGQHAPYADVSWVNKIGRSKRSEERR